MSLIENNSDGTPAARFDWLMQELDKCFPNPHSHLSSQIPEQFYLDEIDKAIRDSKELNAAKKAIVNVFTRGAIK